MSAADPIRAIADAALYEGYVLWPYRRSAMKNAQRWTCGGVYPRAHAEAQPAGAGLALGGLLPRQVALAADSRLVDRQPVALDLAAHDVQEAHAHVEPRVGPALDEALGAHRPRVVVAALAVPARVDAAERPALAVLQRRAPVRPEHVALVEDGVGDRAHRVHAYSSASRSSASIASSHESSELRAR